MDSKLQYVLYEPFHRGGALAWGPFTEEELTAALERFSRSGADVVVLPLHKPVWG